MAPHLGVRTENVGVRACLTVCTAVHSKFTRCRSTGQSSEVIKLVFRHPRKKRRYDSSGGGYALSESYHGCSEPEKFPCLTTQKLNYDEPKKFNNLSFILKRQGWGSIRCAPWETLFDFVCVSVYLCLCGCVYIREVLAEVFLKGVLCVSFLGVCCVSHAFLCCRVCCSASSFYFFLLDAWFRASRSSWRSLMCWIIPTSNPAGRSTSDILPPKMHKHPGDDGWWWP